MTVERVPGFEVRPFLPEDEPVVVALLVSVFDGWPRQLQGADPAAFFRWKHVESPFGQSVMVVAEAGAVIGFEALLRWPVVADGRTVDSVRGADIAVDSAHRGRGVAGALIHAATANIAGEAALAFSNPNAMSDPMLLKLGRRPVGPFEVLVRPRRPLQLLRRALAAAPVDYAMTHFPKGSAARRAAVRAGFIRSPGGHRLLVNPLEEDIDPDPTDTASWALSYGDLELL